MRFKRQNLLVERRLKEIEGETKTSSSSFIHDHDTYFKKRNSFCREISAIWNNCSFRRSIPEDDDDDAFDAEEDDDVGFKQDFVVIFGKLLISSSRIEDNFWMLSIRPDSKPISWRKKKGRERQRMRHFMAQNNIVMIIIRVSGKSSKRHFYRKGHNFTWETHTQ